MSLSMDSRERPIGKSGAAAVRAQMEADLRHQGTVPLLATEVPVAAGVADPELLKLFVEEAREELGYAPMKSDEYRTGYSLESLRDATEMELSSDEDRNGYFLHHSLHSLFRLIHDGWRHELKAEQLGDYNFRMEPLRCDLFDPARTPLLNRVRLRNHVLQRVVELLSLSREGRGRRGRRAHL